MGIFDMFFNPKKVERKIIKNATKPVAKAFEKLDDKIEQAIHTAKGETILEFTLTVREFLHPEIENEALDEFMSVGLDDCAFILGNHSNHVAMLSNQEYEEVRNHPFVNKRFLEYYLYNFFRYGFAARYLDRQVNPFIDSSVDMTDQMNRYQELITKLQKEFEQELSKYFTKPLLKQVFLRTCTHALQIGANSNHRILPKRKQK